MSNPRIEKLEDQIHEILAQTMQRRLTDPRLQPVTLTEVRLTGDASAATVFYTVMGDEQQFADAAVAFESAKGTLRSAVARSIDLRQAPSLNFVPDATAEVAKDMEALLAKARAADAERERESEGKQFAGEADPYRTTE